MPVVHVRAKRAQDAAKNLKSRLVAPCAATISAHTVSVRRPDILPIPRERMGSSDCRSTDAWLRPIPYPYTAMLAICSDLDETPDRNLYFEIMRFLNTTEETEYGRGVGLEVGNSIYFDMPPDQFSYWNTDDTGRRMLQTLIQSGHVDCLHSFGDLATERRHAGRALDELTSHACRLPVWVDHAVAPTNIGDDIMRGEGDLPGSRYYHTDLTFAHGVRFVWRGRVTSTLSQGVRRTLRGILHPRHPYASVVAVAKEVAKGLAGRRQSNRYAMHYHNRLLRPIRLRDGRPALEFLRSNPHWRGVGRGALADDLVDVFTPRVLRTLAEGRGISILYTHLGRTRTAERFGPHVRQAFRALAEYAQDNALLLTTTGRALAYSQMLNLVSFATREVGDALHIDVTIPDVTEHDVPGLTFYIRRPADVRLTINGRVATSVRRNPKDHTGRESVALSWTRLQYPTI